jgi:hypothetical protein
MKTTVEQADALIESIGMTDKVDDYELNELGHVYTCQTGERIVVTSPTNFTLHTGDE